MSEEEVQGSELESGPTFVERHRAVLAGLAILTVVLFVFLMRAFQIFGYTADDTYNTLRYASHLRAGDGLVWNRGERPATEGYTSLLWILVCALPMRLGADPILTAKVIGLASMLLTAAIGVWVVTRMGRKWISTGAAFLCAVVAASTLLLNAEAPVHAVSGTEAAPSLLVLTLLLLLVMRYVAVPRWYTAALLSAVASLAMVLRPEFLLAAAAALGAAYRLTSAKRQLLRFGIIPLAVVAAIYFVWRSYHAWLWLPLPLLVPGGSDARVLAGLDGVAIYLRTWWPVLVLAAAAMRFVFTTGRTLIPSAAALAGLLLVLAFPAHPASGYLRAFLPLAGFLTIFSGLAMAAIARRFEEHWIVTAMIVLLTAFFVWQSDRFGIVRMFVLEDARASRNGHVTLGKALADIDTTGRRSVAVGNAPAVAYYSRWHAIDVRGLNDRQITMRLRAGSFDANQVIGKRPDLLAVESRQGKSFEPSSQMAAELRDRALRSGFRPAGVLKVRDTLFLWLMTPDPSFTRTVTAALERRTSPLVR